MWHQHSTAMIVAFGLGVALGGCVTFDPEREVAGASSLVETRAGATGWTHPWHEPAAAWDGRSPLSSDVAVRVALQNNRALRREVETIVAAHADYVHAHLLPNPIINVTYGLPTDGLGGEPLMAALIQQLTWLWTRPRAIDAAEAAGEERILDVSDTALRLVATVRTQHAEVVAAERRTALHAELVEAIERQWSLVSDQYAAGEAAQVDVNRIDRERQRARAELAEQRATVTVARHTMLELLGRADQTAPWETDGELTALALIPGHSALDESTVIALASTQRLDVAAAEARYAGRRAQRELADAGRAPDVAVGVGYRQNYASRPAWFPSVSVTPKLFDDGRMRLERAESEARQAEIEADGVRQSAMAEARRALAALRGELDAVAAFENGVVIAAAVDIETARRAFEAGEVDLVSVLEAERTLLNARIELVGHRVRAAARVVELERAVGGTLDVRPGTAPDPAPEFVSRATEGGDS